MLTAQLFNQPPIPLLHPDTGKKVKLKLRTMSFAKEISGLPADMLELQRLLIATRNDRNAAVYQMVSVWNKLRIHERYWTSFKFESEVEYLAYYGLPDGSTLAGWTVMVSLFDKPTFVLLGDEVLSFMMRSIGQYETDTDARKQAYQDIFDRYCASHESFDKIKFYGIVRNYVVKYYEKPAAERAGVSHDKWKQDQSRRGSGRTIQRTVVTAPDRQAYGPHLDRDFTWKEERCPSCVSKDQLLAAYATYTAALEKLILEELGNHKLPNKPALLTRQ